jgi:alanine transaminase
LVSQPELLDDDKYPEDVKERARTILDGCRGGSVGNYNSEYLNNYFRFKN